MSIMGRSVLQATSHGYTHWGLVGGSGACDTTRTPWRHGEIVNGPDEASWRLTKQSSRAGKPDHDHELKQVEPISYMFKNYKLGKLGTLHAHGATRRSEVPPYK